MFAYIPARGGSKRIPRKNIRLLDGQPILLRVLRNLAEMGSLTGIAVSTDDSEIHDLVNRQGIATTLTLRDKVLSEDQVSFMDLVRHDLPRYANHFSDKDVLFALATSALVTPEYYKKAKISFESGCFGMVMSITKFDCSPMLALVENIDGSLGPLFPDAFLRPTNEVPNGYSDSGCFYIFNLEKAKKVSKFLDLLPVGGIELPRHVGIDVDCEQDWSRLENEFYKKQIQGLSQ